jgi:hypothetical protein
MAGAAPILIAVRHNGQSIPAVKQTDKERDSPSGRMQTIKAASRPQKRQ